MPCDDKNPLIREGTSLQNRILAALSTGYARVDERDAADLLLFAKRYASRLTYFDPSNTADGDWEALMKMDISVVLATLKKIDLRAISDYKKLLHKRIRQATTDADAKREFKYLFDLCFSLVSLIDEQYKQLGEGVEYKNIIRDVIQHKLQLPAANLEKCFNEFKAPSLLDYSVAEHDGEAPLKVTSDKLFSRANLSDDWKTAVPDISITLPVLPDTRSLIVYISNHNLFNAQTDLLVNGTASLVKHAGVLFDQTISDFPEHTPHYALFIAFVRLFGIAQDHLNTYTGRHLDFYYKEGLQLKNKNPEPDSAHLTFELQKPVKQKLLPKGTLFKAGKDITGREITYSLGDDLVVNKTTLRKIQSWAKTEKNKKPFLIASPVANSGDGQGGKITSADSSWHTFGDTRKAGNARAGFAIASNLLFLNEGKRDITIRVTFTGNILDLKKPGIDTACFTAELTGKKDWFKISEVAVSFPSATQLEFAIALHPEDPPIIPYSEKIHKQQLATDLPLLKIYLDQDHENAISWFALCALPVSSIAIEVAGAELKDLVLSNDMGSVSASKPFQPFGNFPLLGASLCIGSKEIFQKQLTEITLNPVWQGAVPALNATVNYLRQSNWSDHFTLSSNTIKFAAPEVFVKSAIGFGANEPLTATTLEGFLRIKLGVGQFSLEKHLADVSKVLSNTYIVKDTASATPKYNISIPPTPLPSELILSSFSVSYKAAETISFSDSDQQNNNLFFHVTPFGYAEVHPRLFIDGISATEKAERLTLVPNVTNDGELFLGLENGEPDSVVTLLFQVADGSSNPLKKAETLKWFYLTSGNNWKQFTLQQVVDNTRNFTRSGVVVFTLPSDISNSNSLLEKGLCWIKCCAEHNTDAVCKMISVIAQAGRVELVQDDAGGIEFRQNIPGGTISKLVTSDAAFKTVSQPFASSGGRIRERDDQFYVRVSERLRHKQRAISIWDYEHIVLEKFQQVYKVKCLNHSGFYETAKGEVFCENLPGHVTLITIPDLKKTAAMNPLRPYTSIALLTGISDYLKTIVSPFPELHVINPQFEEIRLNFKVKFHDHLDISMYQQLLNMEIEKFLSPWAWDDGAEISFGGKIVKSVLLNFVEERPYVDFVTCFTMDHIIKREGAVITEALVDVEEAVASTARSVLVSYCNEDETDESLKRHVIETNVTCKC